MGEDSLDVPLKGGNVGVGIVRVGDTVRRPAMPWTKSVDTLLLHLESVGFEGSPRAMGYDESGRQVLSFVDGYVDPDPSDLDTGRVSEVGRLIRRFHDASSTFTPAPGALWNVAIAPDKEELVCHHDLAPWNLVRTSVQLTFIDWDGAGPGSRLWDLAYAAHGFVPLSPDASLSDEAAATRLASLVNGYGLEKPDRLLLVAMLGPRIRSMYELLRSGHRSGLEPWSRLWTEGHGRVWLADAHYVKERTHVWTKALD